MIEAHRGIEAGLVTLAWAGHAGHDCLRVLGATSAGALAVIPASVLRTGLRNLQPLAGAFEVDGDALCFIPRFPFVPGLNYALVRRSSDGGYETLATLQRPSSDAAPTTEVLAIYPTAPSVPVNLLKLYVYFSAPMSEGNAARAVHVRRDDTNEELHAVFLPNGLELWDRERTRLTLLLDPGRIKRGLLPHQQMGYPLIEGVPITVAIDHAFRDAAGRPLRATAERRFEVAPALRTPIKPAAWAVTPPAAGSREALTLTFDRPLDRALLGHALTVRDPEGARVLGQITLGPAEQSWRFTPEAPWQTAAYTVAIDPRLEDLAGNSLTRVFDRDLTITADDPVSAPLISIPFTCPAALRSS